MNSSDIRTFILDTLFPISCLSCRKPDNWICEECLAGIKIASLQVCPYCEKTETQPGSVCPACKTGFYERKEAAPLDNLIVSTRYENVSKLVHTFKYNFVQALAEPLGKLMILAIIKSDLPVPDIIMPVPLHPRRLRWRGFNQSELLAKIIRENLTPGLSIPLEDTLQRNKFTPPQMKVKNYKERQENIANAFTLSSSFVPSALNGKSVLLIDDICTTGSTLFECAKVLKANGAKKVFGAVIARQEYSKKI